MSFFRSKSGTARVIIALVIIIVLSGAAVAYITFKPHASISSTNPSPTATPTSSPSSSPTSSPSPTPKPTSTPIQTSTTSSTPVPVSSTPTPTNTPSPTAAPSPTPAPTNTHTVAYKTMMTGNEIDYWNVSFSSSYTVTLTDTMSVGAQPDQLGILAESSLNDVNSNLWIWNVNFVNSTFFYYWVNTGAGNGPQGHLNTVDGLVTVAVTSTSIEFIGSGTGQYIVIDTPFQNLMQIQTSNGENGAAFTSGELSIRIQ